MSLKVKAGGGKVPTGLVATTGLVAGNEGGVDRIGAGDSVAAGEVEAADMGVVFTGVPDAGVPHPQVTRRSAKAARSQGTVFCGISFPFSTGGFSSTDNIQCRPFNFL